MGFWEFVTVWYNVLFTIPLALVFLFALLQLIGIGLEIGEADPALHRHHHRFRPERIKAHLDEM